MVSIKIWLIIALSVPSVVALLILGFTKDGIVTIASMCGTFYLIPFLYNKMATEFDWKIKLAPETPNLTKKNLMDGNFFN